MYPGGAERKHQDMSQAEPIASSRSVFEVRIPPSLAVRARSSAAEEGSVAHGLLFSPRSSLWPPRS